ncbi:hypothetical protein PAAG_04663 [Paracoccidioides lutzii Pb01]|uniref:C6 zinc finger domain-containing protein n=1 Tax=Paracoccidioides lutzii (strain ATCC MYA-826 / Pb01) TaxID=502779 RepID=C1H233_PARBA|nr:hypothetical protein PAAG_04663 [Paracoccidioides lutzii Pb01]EEH33613.2 hypothetical protein PAAG_04663 [Paracoccidioides lutzii Pb01]
MENCTARKLDCVYPVQFKLQSQQLAARRLIPDHSKKNRSAAVFRLTTSPSASSPSPSPLFSTFIRPIGVLQLLPTSSTIEDMRFFHHYMIAAHLYLPFGCDGVWVNDIPQLAHQYEYLMHAILSLGALHLSLMNTVNTGLETSPSYTAMQLHSTTNTLPTATSTQTHELNAMLATCYALAVQSSHIMDGFTDFLILVRGCGRLDNHISVHYNAELRTLPLNVKGPDMYVLYPHLVNGNDNGDDEASLVAMDMPTIQCMTVAVRALSPLLQHDWDWKYHELILTALEALRRRAWVDAFIHFQDTYVVWCSMDEANFPEHIISILAPVRKSKAFLILFVHFTAIQTVMLPIILRAIPLQARFPQLMLLQVRWLNEISCWIPDELQQYLSVPLEAVGRLGGECGVRVRQRQYLW